VLSDIHFPETLPDELAQIIKMENADTTVFLGDSIAARSVEPFAEFVQNSGARNPIFVIGDNEVESGLSVELPYVESYETALGNAKFTFMHGHQFNVRSDNTTASIASMLKKLNRNLPLVCYGLKAKVQCRKSGYLVLGHCHALAFFARLKVACAGCLTTSTELYNDRGYMIIQDSGSARTINLTLKRLNPTLERTYTISA
jgi:predicted phosphodiesterase